MNEARPVSSLSSLSLMLFVTLRVPGSHNGPFRLNRHWQLASGLLTLSSHRLLRLSRRNLHSSNCYDTHSERADRETHKLFLLGNWKLTVTIEREEVLSSAASGGSLTARSESKCCLGPFSCLVYNDHPGLRLSRHNASVEHQGRF